jgi:hypothetical protein
MPSAAGKKKVAVFASLQKAMANLNGTANGIRGDNACPHSSQRLRTARRP